MSIVMCDAKDKLLTSRTRSLYSTSPCSKRKFNNTAWKSDVHIPPAENLNPIDRETTIKAVDGCGEYYKRYEHDEIPVKDLVTSSHIIGTGDSERIASLTSSLLERLEKNVLKKYESQELQTDGSSFESLDSHIKIFQTTVKEIFDTFYSNMQDYEVYKKRYNDILEKNKADTLVEMEEFIKDMIQHIVSAEPSNTSITSNLTYDLKDAEVKTSVLTNNFDPTESHGSMLQSFKNKQYLGESATEENASSRKQSLKSGEVFNIYLVSTSSSIAIKVNDRNMCSEINIKDQKSTVVDSKIASADNLRRPAIKKQDNTKDDTNADREIPIKLSSPKKNIHLNEDFQCEQETTEKSFLSRICGYFCKRFRKTT